VRCQPGHDRRTTTRTIRETGADESAIVSVGAVRLLEQSGIDYVLADPGDEDTPGVRVRWIDQYIQRLGNDR